MGGEGFHQITDWTWLSCVTPTGPAIVTVTSRRAQHHQPQGGPLWSLAPQVKQLSEEAQKGWLPVCRALKTDRDRWAGLIVRALLGAGHPEFWLEQRGYATEACLTCCMLVLSLMSHPPPVSYYLYNGLGSSTSSSPCEGKVEWAYETRPWCAWRHRLPAVIAKPQSLPPKATLCLCYYCSCLYFLQRYPLKYFIFDQHINCTYAWGLAWYFNICTQYVLIKSFLSSSILFQPLWIPSKFRVRGQQPRCRSGEGVTLVPNRSPVVVSGESSKTTVN